MATEISDAASQLATVLATIATGELVCTAAMRHRIEGARLALEALAASPGNGRMTDAVRAAMDGVDDLH